MRLMHVFLTLINTAMLVFWLHEAGRVLTMQDYMLCDLINNTGGICLRSNPDIHPGQNNRNVFCPNKH